MSSSNPKNNSDYTSLQDNSNNTHNNPGLSLETKPPQAPNPASKKDSNQENLLDSTNTDRDIPALTKTSIPTCKELLTIAPSFFKKSLPLVILKASPFIINLAGFFFLGFFNNTTLTAAFGVGCSLYLFFNLVFTQMAGEIVAIVCGKNYGENNYESLRLNCYRGYFLNLLIFVFGICFYIRADLLLIAINFDPKIAVLAHYMILT